MKTIEVDFDDLIFALEEEPDSGVTWYLDVDSGATMPLVDEPASGEVDESWSSDDEVGLADVEELQAGRHLPVPRLERQQSWIVMTDFVETLPHTDASVALKAALAGRGAFRRFTHDVARFGLEGAWHGYRRRRILSMALEWLESEGLIPATLPKWSGEGQTSHAKEEVVDSILSVALETLHGTRESFRRGDLTAWEVAETAADVAASLQALARVQHD